MDFDHVQWCKKMLKKLQGAFGNRLLYAALAGSYARGEAHESSDIDINLVLDRVDMNDLNTCREILSPRAQTAIPCGFVCGRDELAAWPPHELFHFMMGSRVLYGSLEGIVKLPSSQDIKTYIRNASSAVLHAVRHTYIYGGETAPAADTLKEQYKNAFFILQALAYIETGRYIATQKEMLRRSAGADREIMSILINWDSLGPDRRSRPQEFFYILKTGAAGCFYRLQRASADCMRRRDR